MTIWIIGVIGAVVAVGPLLGPGAVLDLDFVLLPHAPVPNGLWALGPELPRRMPVMLPIAWSDPVVGSVVAGKAMVVLALAASFVGATRLAGSVPMPWRCAAGVLYAFGPFAMPRVAVGHLFVLVAMAVLPFALPHLLRPTEDLRRTFRWSFALGLAGVLGGVFAVACLCVGAIGRGRRGAVAFGLGLVAQVTWLVPGALVFLLDRPDPASAAAFRPDVEGIAGLAGIGAGQGFWLAGQQTGWGPLVDGVCGLAVVALAVYGRRALRGELPRLPVVAGLALALVVLAASPVSDVVVELLAVVPGGDVLREPQRVLPLYLVWAAPAATLGAARLAGRVGDASSVHPAALVLAFVIVAPGLWGAGGRVDPVEVPSDWRAVRNEIDARRGTVLALPWFLYLDLDVADGRRVNNPLPLWIGGDVLVGSDPRVPGDDARERSDPREPRAQRLIADNLGGAPIGAPLADLGVRWVVVLEDGDVIRGQRLGTLHQEALEGDPGLRPVVRGPTMSLYEVVGWRGDVVAVDGDRVEFEPIIGPFARLAASDEAVYARPYAPGWMRGFRAASETGVGTVALPPGDGLLWYWPSVISVISLAGVAAAFLGSFRLNSRNRDHSN